MYTSRGTLDRQAAVNQYGQLVRRVAAQLIATLPANVEMDDLVQAGISSQQQEALTRSALSGWALGSEAFMTVLRQGTERQLAPGKRGRPTRV